MVQEVRVPEIGENVHSGEVVKVMVSVGDTLNVDQPIAELETDKAVLEFPSPVAGRISKIMMKAGDTVAIGQVVLEVESDGVKAPEPRKVAPAAPQKAQKAAPTTASIEPPRAAAEPKQPVAFPAVMRSGPDVAASPAVRRLARELGVELSRVIGSGTGGRISPEDVKEFVRSTLAGQTSAPREATSAPSARPSCAATRTRRSRRTPSSIAPAPS